MSFDLFPYEGARELQRASLRPSIEPEPGFFSGFVPGAATLTMEGFAKTARSIDLVGAAGPIVTDKLTGGTTEQDRYFQEHDEVFNHAVDYWTPKPGSVGTAGRVVGSLLPVLGEFAISPALAIGTAGLGTAEDLTREGVTPGKAIAAGEIEATGLGLGAWMPFLGKTLAGKIAFGAAANVAQGVVTRAAERKVLEGTEAAKRYNPWDGEAAVIDALMGAGFGAIAHAGTPKRVLSPIEKDATLTANQARHLEDTTAPGLPDTPLDRTAHVQAMEKAINDVLQGRPADVAQILQDAQFHQEPARTAAHEEVRQAVGEEARRIITDEVAREARVAAAEEVPGFLRSAEDLLALKDRADVSELAPQIRAAIDVAKKPGFQRTADEKRLLDAFMKGRGGELLLGEIKPPAGPPLPRAAPEAPPKAGERAQAPKEGQGEALAPKDPLVAEAEAHIAQSPGELKVRDEDGKVIDLAERLKERTEAAAQAKQDRGIFQTAAACFLGVL